ncbi:unnamed protein product [Prorocentrum cordatum]|uniref:Uncharacterized protein n=1 Tax=Prorocentrum cordatum TaxID=2364126 RepID=A0ABN9QHY8_9DINO|nr:unnamed protein product [Polarella glacialis]
MKSQSPAGGARAAQARRGAHPAARPAARERGGPPPGGAPALGRRHVTPRSQVGRVPLQGDCRPHALSRPQAEHDRGLFCTALFHPKRGSTPGETHSCPTCDAEAPQVCHSPAAPCGAQASWGPAPATRSGASDSTEHSRGGGAGGRRRIGTLGRQLQKKTGPQAAKLTGIFSTGHADMWMSSSTTCAPAPGGAVL